MASPGQNQPPEPGISPAPVLSTGPAGPSTPPQQPSGGSGGGSGDGNDRTEKPDRPPPTPQGEEPRERFIDKTGSFSQEDKVEEYKPEKQREGTRSNIAMLLAWTVIGVVAALAGTYCYLLVKVTLLAASTSDGGTKEPKAQLASIKEAVEGLQPLLTMLLSQTLFPLATIAIGWYFATRLSERTAEK